MSLVFLNDRGAWLAGLGFALGYHILENCEKISQISKTRSIILSANIVFTLSLVNAASAMLEKVVRI